MQRRLRCSKLEHQCSIYVQRNTKEQLLCSKSGCVILFRLSCGCVDRGRVVLGRFGVVFNRFGGVISWSLGEVSENRVVLRSIGVVSSWGQEPGASV